MSRRTLRMGMPWKTTSVVERPPLYPFFVIAE